MMARTYKFIILEASYDEIMDTTRHSKKVIDSINYVWDDHIRVVECKHEKFEDNCVDLYQEDGETANFVQSVGGVLYYWTDVMTKTEIIEAFE
jgi:hypothetical protein